MPRYVAFLRGINLGKRRPAMSELKGLFEKMGFADVATFIASGNVVFSSRSKETPKLESKIAQHLQKALGYDVDTFVRTAEEIVSIATAKVFAEEGNEGATIHVAFLHAPLSKSDARKLEQIKTAQDEFRVAGREYYWLCRIKTIDSDVWQLPEMKALKLPTATMRNLTSIRKLVAKLLT